jgi:hypothetical protein
MLSTRRPLALCATLHVVFLLGAAGCSKEKGPRGGPGDPDNPHALFVTAGTNTKVNRESFDKITADWETPLRRVEDFVGKGEPVSSHEGAHLEIQRFGGDSRYWFLWKNKDAWIALFFRPTGEKNGIPEVVPDSTCGVGLFVTNLGDRFSVDWKRGRELGRYARRRDGCLIGNPRVTSANFEKLQGEMPLKQIEAILGLGERLPEPPRRQRGGIWYEWRRGMAEEPGKRDTVILAYFTDINPGPDSNTAHFVLNDR